MFVDPVIGICLEAWHVFAAREDARPPGQGPAKTCALMLTRMGTCRTKATLFMGQDTSILRYDLELGEDAIGKTLKELADWATN